MVLDEVSNTRADADLLREFARTGSDEVFSELRTRHVDWVYSVALRQLGNDAAAQDVTQAVFVILARKAASLGNETILAGWLFRAVRYLAMDAIRMELRRKRREEIAAREADSTGAPEQNWDEVAPVIDECLAKLRPAEQRAILLRYYEQKPWRDIGEALGLNENAARVRVDRALEKLRKFLARRGLAGSASALSAALLANAVQASPISISSAPSASVLALTRTALRRWRLRKIEIGASLAAIAVGLALAIVSFFAIPRSQLDFQRDLLGPEAFGALVDLDRAYMDANPDAFITRIHFRDAGDERARPALREFLQAAAGFRQAGIAMYRDSMFGYYETLPWLYLGHQPPTRFERAGKHAAGSFWHQRGLQLIEVDGVWKWDFFADYDPARVEQLRERAKILRELKRAISEGAPASQIRQELRER